MRNLGGEEYGQVSMRYIASGYCSLHTSIWGILLKIIQLSVALYDIMYDFT